MSYAPPGESASDLWLERSYFVGGFLAAVAYGFHCSIFGTCVYFLLRHPSRGNRPPNFKLIIFVTFIWIIATINLGTGIKWNEMMWIDDRNYPATPNSPGGPIGFLFGAFSDPINTLGSTTYVINNCLTDFMVLHRALVIWGYNYYVIAIPFLAIVTSTILSVLTLVQSALPGANLWSHVTFSFAVPYWSLSISINILLTLMIVFRLVTARNSLRDALGAEYAKTYTSLIAIVIESAAIYSTFSLIYIVAFARNSNVQNLFLPVLGQVMCIAPELIIMRVAFGRAFSRETAANLSGIRFRSGPSETTAGATSTATASGAINIGSFGLGGGEKTGGTSRSDGLVTPEGSKWDVTKKEREDV